MAIDLYIYIAHLTELEQFLKRYDRDRVLFNMRREKRTPIN